MSTPAQPSTALIRARDWARLMATTTTVVIVNPRDIKALHEHAYPTDDERVIWQQIADEIDAFLGLNQPTDPAQLTLETGTA